MEKERILKKLWDQTWDCVYCGQAIHPGEEICRAFDNDGIAHLRCHGIGKAPHDPGDWFCPICGRPARENTVNPVTICCDHCEVVMEMRSIT